MTCTVTQPPNILVIGIGNEYRSDDGVGRTLVRALMPVPERVRVIEHSGEGTALMEVWHDVERVILVDAVHSGGLPGSIYRLDAEVRPIPRQFFHYSTHAFSVAEAIEMARSLGRLPPRLIIYGIEGANFDAGVELSPEIVKIAGEVLQRIRDEIKEMRGSYARNVFDSGLNT